MIKFCIIYWVSSKQLIYLDKPKHRIHKGFKIIVSSVGSYGTISVREQVLFLLDNLKVSDNVQAVNRQYSYNWQKENVYHLLKIKQLKTQTHCSIIICSVLCLIIAFYRIKIEFFSKNEKRTKDSRPHLVSTMSI
jgi:hypothetical protein